MAETRRLSDTGLVQPAQTAVVFKLITELDFLRFADDRIALQIIAGLGRGLTPEQICDVLCLSKTDYDSARKRMRRRLLREGLTCAE